MSANVLLISTTILKERTGIHGNIDEKLLYPDIKYAQDSYILPLLGTALFNKLQTIIADGTITSNVANVNYKALLDTYIIDAMVYYTLAEMPLSIGYQFWNKGVVRKIGENTENPSMSELVDIANRYKNRAENYANRMKEYIKANAATKFPEYLNPGSTTDTVTPEQRAFTLPIYLGDYGHDPYCNPGGFNGQPYSE
jgi:hypothetical protein